jgi:hypothetical protein
MKGIPTFRPKRLKQAAVLTGVTALIAAGTVLGSGVAHAAGPVPVSDLGNGQGTLGISEQSGKTTDSITYSSPACPSTANGSAEVEIADPSNPTQSQQLLAGVNNSVSSAFTFTSSGATDMSNAISGLFDDPAGGTAEIVVECFPQASGNGTGVFENDVFVQLDATDANFTVVPNPGTGSSSQSVNLTLSANPNPATSGQTVTLTATASVASATGSVAFENNGTVIGSPVTLSGGTATTTFTAPTVTSAATETLSAVYTPSGTGFTAGTAGSLSLPVNPAAANSGTIPLAVTVPQTGSFALTVDSTDTVTLTASGSSATGTTTPITVADTRNTFPGWSVSGQDGAWTGTGTAAGGTFSGSQLGWTPTDTALAQGVQLGSVVTGGSTGGLGTAAALASVHAGMGNGSGTSTLGANLLLAIPSTAPAGPYTSSLTISAVTSNP